MGPLWGKALSLQRSGRQAQIREQLKPLRMNVDQLNRFRDSERDLQVYLFQWLVNIIAFIAAAIACALVARSLVGISTKSQQELLTASLVLLLTAVISSLVMLRASFDYTAAGSAKRLAKLEGQIAKLTDQLER
jgi:hypothetical protein